MRKVYFLITVLLCVSFVSFSQLDITYPTSRAVFQRNNDNVGTIYFGGNFSTKLNRIEARLVAINGGSTLDWMTIVDNPISGIYTSQLTSLGGWYKLEVRGIRDESIVVSASIDKVGIGEVFVICGQSNAEGKTGVGDGASDDRVSRIGNLESSTESVYPFPTFDRIERTSVIAPSGKSAWCWGRLGDLLVNRLGVPILFINTAWEGYDIKQWEVSANGGRGFNTFGQIYAPAGFPFNTIKNSVQQYTHMLGLRAVLFHQGETDNDLNTTQLEYYNSMSVFIEKLREGTQKDISFVVSRASRNLNSTSQSVIDAQNQIISQVPNVFSGPSTDDITDRFDGLHFSTEGTRQVADRWDAQLDANFFATSKPILSSNVITPTSFCFNPNVNSPMVLVLPSELQNPSWSNGVNGYRVSVGEGTYQGRATDNIGNTSFTPTINFASPLIPAKPTINLDGPQQFCSGASITRLNSSYDFNNQWSTNATTNGINVGSQGNYSVTHTNVYGCLATSDPVEITVFPKPEVEITASGPTDICSDEELFLTSNVTLGNEWSNNETSQRIQVQNTGDISLTVTNSFGCKNTSEPISINVRPEAAKPTIGIDGGIEFCADQSTNLIALSSDPDSTTRFIWNTEANTKTLTVSSAGNYSVLAINSFDCAKRSDDVSIKVNPLPIKPIITADGETILCDDRSLRLSTNQQTGYAWSTGDTLRDITVFGTGDYTVQTVDNNGCISPTSDPLKVQFFETPLKPSVEKSGVFSIKATLPRDLENVSYNWTNGATILNRSTAEIKANEPGNYQAQAYTVYSIEDGRTLRCTSTFSDILFVDIDVSVTYQVYPNPTVNKTLSIETLENYKNTYVTIYDTHGRLVKRFFVTTFDSKQIFDLSNVTEGSYILKLDNPNLTVTRRIIIQ